MSGYTSGNTAPTLMAQAPNRQGNIGRVMASHTTGVTAVTRPQGSLSQPPGNQGAPKCMKATANTNVGVTSGIGQKVMVAKAKQLYDGNCHNDGYMNADRTNYLK